MTSEQKELSTWTTKRGFVRQRITKLNEKINAQYQQWSKQERATNLFKCKELREEIISLDDKILTKCIEAEMSAHELSNHSDSDESYRDALVGMITLLESPMGAPDNDNTDEQTAPSTGQNSSSRLKLPQVQLPEYGNKKGENLGKFLRGFEAIISKHRLSSYEKFVHLQKQLSGGPKVLIDSLEIDQHSYENAKDLLTQAFDSTDRSKHDIISSLANLKLGANEQPYNYIGQIRTIIAAVKSLDITVEQIIQYFVWNGLNREFQSHLTSITNKCKPTLDEINASIFEATERYMKQLSYKNNDKTKTNYSDKNNDSTVMAINVKSEKSNVFCILCSSEKKPKDHYLRNCTVYISAKNKFDQLRKIKACTKCAFNHETSDCKFVFKSNCRNCSGAHMSYLCCKPPRQGSFNATASARPNAREHNETTNSVSYIEASQLSMATSMILPTFTAGIIVDGDVAPVRVFKDGGCQSTFICSAMAEALDLPIIQENVPLVVHGFNASKRIVTKVVSLQLKIGQEIFAHEAICVKGIRTSFNVDGIGKIVSAFEDNGFRLADTSFSTSTSGLVDNIDLVLGTDSDHMLPMTYKTFGDQFKPNELASFIETPIGVVLSGSMDKMFNNLKFLTDKKHLTVNNVSIKYPEIINYRKTVDNSIVENFTHSQIENNSFSSIDELLNKDDFSYSPTVGDIASQESDDILISKCKTTLNICDDIKDTNETDTNVQLVDFVLENTNYDEENRLLMPLLWNNKNSHLLSRNYKLASKVLESNLIKLNKDPNKLKMYNDVIREQEEMGIIKRINNLDNFLLEHPEASFLCHQGVFRMSHESTKCRVVFLSNMHEKFNNGISHNMAMLPGPNLNHKITTAVLLNRFDKFILAFDIKKAFLSISLYDCDQSRLCFLWYRNVEKNDYTVVGFQNVRLSFGLRCSPAILMLGLYKLLIVDTSGNEQTDAMKRAIYNSIYMDNGSYSCNNEDELLNAYRTIIDIFEPHKLFLQQFGTNSVKVQNKIDQSLETETCNDVKFFGMTWHRVQDTLTPMLVRLDESADTKRKVLASLNSIYDVFNLYAPILLRAKLFLQRLLAGSVATWDAKLSPELQKEWQSICRQANTAPAVSMPRCVGARDSNFALIAMTDASKDAYGAVVYIKNLETDQVSYLTAKNRLINTTTAKKTIPSLELQAIAFGVETLFDVHQSLSGDTVVIPIKISSCYLFTDSMVCLHWIIKYSVYFEKLQSLSVFVKNRLSYVDKICAKMPVTFSHVSGADNPSDYLTRPTSPKVLAKSSYYEGPAMLSNNLDEILGDLVVTLPNPTCKSSDEVPSDIGCATVQTSCPSPPPSSSPGVVDASPKKLEHLVPLEKYSDLRFLINVTANVLKFIHILKGKVAKKMRADVDSDNTPDVNFHEKATNFIIRTEQEIIHPDVYSYLDSSRKHKKEIPTLITKYNLYRDENGILRIKSKFSEDKRVNPILISNGSKLTELIIMDTHTNLGHLGIYPVIRQLRKFFWIEKCFTAVKKCLKKCITCKRIHERSIKTNQNSYREFRSHPPQIPFRSIFIDHIGPFTVCLQGKRTKVWLLAISCLWSRAINLKVCLDLTVKEFLKAMQLHCHEYGMFEECLSDLGSQIQAGAHTIKAFMSDFETKQFLSSNGIRELKFQHYAKGNSSLGSLIETCVKQVKFFIQKSIRTNVLDYFEFTFLISKAICLINKRPVAFLESLRSLSPDQVPTSITPEMLIRGFDCAAVNLIPQLQHVQDNYEPGKDSEFIRDEYQKLGKVREKMVEIYHEDFLTNLIYQAVDKVDRYKPILHKIVKPGDIVLLSDKHLKQYRYPMGRVISIEQNSIGETTAARVFKGDTKEIVYRHITSLILLLSGELCQSESDPKVTDSSTTNSETTPCGSQGVRPKSTRQAAVKFQKRLNQWKKDDSI